MIKERQKRFLALYEPNHDRFERFCRARVYGRMEYQDLINESLLIAYEKLDTLHSEKHFLSFIIGISIRVLSNFNKKKKEVFLTGKEQIEVLEEQISSGAIEVAMEVEHLYKMLDQLNEEQKECLILFELTGFSIKEIMELQKASESTVKQRLRRGRIQLKELIEHESKIALKTKGAKDE